MKSEKFLLIWDRMGDYHRSRWNALSQLMSKENVYAADLGTSDNLYKWPNTENQDHYLLLSKKPVDSFDLFFRLKKYIFSLKSNNITIVCIPGYGRLEYLLFIVLAKFLKVKVILFAESWYGEKKIFNTFKSLFINLFCDFVFVSGQKAFDHFHKKLNLPPEKIITGYSVVDNKHFINKEKKIKFYPVILCVARFSKEKNLINLIEAFNKSKIKDHYSLKLVGGGVQKEVLKTIAKENPKILLNDWIPYDELPEAYNKSAIFILPSSFEPWGLVINEAMASGLPIIASKQCGCVPDLITEANGFTFNANNLQELISLLDKIAEIPTEKLIEMGKISQNTIEEYSPETWANKLLKVL